MGGGLLLFTLLLFNVFCFSQSGQKFATGLNSLSGTDALGTSNLFPLIIKTNGTEWLRITETGKVGIGKTNPSELLDVNGMALALSMKAQSAEFSFLSVTTDIKADAIHINKETHLNGILTVGSLAVPCPKCGPTSGTSITLDATKRKHCFFFR